MMENTNQIEQTIKFLQIDAELLNKSHIKAPDGTLHILGGFERMLYSYMVFRYNFFKSQEKGFFEEQETFHKFFPWVSMKTVQRAIQSLERCGMITVQRKSGKKGKGNNYIVHPYVAVDAENSNDKMKRVTSFSKENQPIKQKQISKQDNNYHLEYPDDIPF